MANALVFLSDLQRGRSSSTLQVRLLRFWDPRNVGRGGDLMGVDMLLLDSQVLGGEKYEERRQPYRCRPSPPRCKSVSGQTTPQSIS
ncbi:uncharacterized protein LOC108872317 isoform X4 [Brassica rapa]|uniref:uncharacterized protein LOC108872317 isoform X4 n=1 Tax=Brassica campestris TaxID=3711 RepID=UPI00142DDAF0|nr:uncharacterized protein LOC108872317 isoform X4 [Brassica rapa]